MTVVLGYAGPVVDPAEIRPAVTTATGLELDVAVRRNRVDRVVDQIGDDLAKQERVSAHLHLVRRFLQREQNFLGTGSRPGHAQGSGDQLVEVHWFSRVGDAWSGSLRETLQH